MMPLPPNIIWVIIVIIILILLFMFWQAEFVPSELNFENDGGKLLSDSNSSYLPLDKILDALVKRRNQLKKKFQRMHLKPDRTADDCMMLNNELQDYINDRELMRQELIKRHLFFKSLIHGLWNLAASSTKRQLPFLHMDELPKVKPDTRKAKDLAPLIITPTHVQIWLDNFKAKYYGSSHLHLKLFKMGRGSGGGGRSAPVPPTDIIAANAPHITAVYNMSGAGAYDRIKPVAGGKLKKGKPTPETLAKIRESQGFYISIEQQIRDITILKNKIRGAHHKMRRKINSAVAVENLEIDIGQFVTDRVKLFNDLILRHLYFKRFIELEWNKVQLHGNKQKKFEDITKLAQDICPDGKTVCSTEQLTLKVTQVDDWLQGFHTFLRGPSFMNLVPAIATDFDERNQMVALLKSPVLSEVEKRKLTAPETEVMFTSSTMVQMFARGRGLSISQQSIYEEEQANSHPIDEHVTYASFDTEDSLRTQTDEESYQ